MGGCLPPSSSRNYSLSRSCESSMVTILNVHPHGYCLNYIKRLSAKEARIYNGEKTASSISGAGKNGQLHVKE